MIPSYAFGLDYGNTDTCGYLIENHTKRYRVIPSAIAHGSLSELATKRSATENTFDRDVDALRADEHVIEIGEHEFFVGSLALTESKEASTGRGDNNRYWSAKALAVLLTVSGDMIGSMEYELYLVTGLPIETFTKENRAKVVEALSGTHHFTLRGRKRRAIVHVVRVVMEGAGAMIAYGKNEEVLQGVIDIGGRTTDLYAANGQKPVAELCKGKPLGVESIVDLVNSKYNTLYRGSLKSSESRRLLRAYLGQDTYPIIQSYGSRPSQEILHSWVESAIDQVSQDILSFVSRIWSSSEQGDVAADIAPVLIIGGGAYYFSKKVKSRIPHIITPMKPETANAEGYLTLAHLLMNRNKAIA